DVLDLAEVLTLLVLDLLADDVACPVKLPRQAELASRLIASRSVIGLDRASGINKEQRREHAAEDAGADGKSCHGFSFPREISLDPETNLRALKHISGPRFTPENGPAMCGPPAARGEAPTLDTRRLTPTPAIGIKLLAVGSR